MLSRWLALLAIFTTFTHLTNGQAIEVGTLTTSDAVAPIGSKISLSCLYNFGSLKASSFGFKAGPGEDTFQDILQCHADDKTFRVIFQSGVPLPSSSNAYSSTASESAQEVCQRAVYTGRVRFTIQIPVQDLSTPYRWKCVAVYNSANYFSRTTTSLVIGGLPMVLSLVSPPLRPEHESNTYESMVVCETSASQQSIDLHWTTMTPAPSLDLKSSRKTVQNKETRSVLTVPSGEPSHGKTFICSIGSPSLTSQSIGPVNTRYIANFGKTQEEHRIALGTIRTIYFQCGTQSYPEPTYEWYEESNRIPTASMKINRTIEGVLDRTVVYKCSASNGYQSVNKSFVIIMGKGTPLGSQVFQLFEPQSWTVSAAIAVGLTCTAVLLVTTLGGRAVIKRIRKCRRNKQGESGKGHHRHHHHHSVPSGRSTTLVSQEDAFGSSVVIEV